jgi:hypothetical protein
MIDFALQQPILTIILGAIYDTYANSWYLKTQEQTLLSGGNKWFQRLLTNAEPHGITVSNDGVLSLIRLRDGKLVDIIAQKQW